MLSRVAENLYWISRYVERAEYVARLLDDAYHLELDAGFSNSPLSPLDSVLTILSCRDAFEKLHQPPPAPDDRRDAVLYFLTFDRGDIHSIRAMIARGRENARSTQDTLSTEAWSHLNKMYLYLASPRADERFRSSTFRFLARMKRECILFSAIIDGTLPRTEVYHFLQVGRYIERIDMLSRILNTHCVAPPAVAVASTVGSDAATAVTHAGAPMDASRSLLHWTGLLRSCSAFEAFTRESHERIEPARVVRYLLLEDSFPRSMRFAVLRCIESLRAIAAGAPGTGSDAERHLGRLDSDLRYMDIDDMMNRGIEVFLRQVQECCAAVGRDIHQAYFRT